MSLQFRSKLKMLAPSPKLLFWAFIIVIGIGALLNVPGYAASPEVETYVQQATPDDSSESDRFNSPLQAGQMTLEDVLAAHPAPKKMIPAPPITQVQSAPLSPPRPTGQPSLSSTSHNSSTNVMLMQGMKSALQQSSDDGSTLTPPQLRSSNSPVPLIPEAQSPTATDVVESQPSGPIPTSMPPPAEDHVPATNLVQSPVSTISVAPSNLNYQPGQAPRNLAAGVPAANAATTTPPLQAGSAVVPLDSISPATSPTATEIIQQPASLSAPVQESATPPANADVISTSSQPAPPALQPVMSAPQSAPNNGNCVPHISSWTKSCSDAGYPASYTGQIHGETRTVCPENSLQDVWISNSCSAPDASGASAPLTAPDKTTANTTSAKTAGVVAQCGPATSKPRHDMPNDDLCDAGKPTTVTGNGPWTWTCRDPNGGGTPTSCEAPAIIDGACGSANGQDSEKKPSSNLCAKGNATYVSGKGPWSWSCTGINGGDSESCTATKSASSDNSDAVTASASKAAVAADTSIPAAAPAAKPVAKPIAPAATTATVTYNDTKLCGSAAELMAIEAPDKNLCANGTASDVTGSGPWTWTCLEDSGHKSKCTTLSPLGNLSDAPSQPVATVDPSIAPAPIANPRMPVTSSEPHTAPPAAPAPKTSAAAAAVPASMNGDPECGLAAGATTTQQPIEDFCTTGTASPVSGSGPWKWNCSTGSGSVTCSSYKQIDAMCGGADGTTQKRAPSKNLCALGNASKVKGSGPWSWSCANDAGTTNVKCSAKKSAAQAEKTPDSDSTMAPEAAPVTATVADNVVPSAKPFAAPPQPTKAPQAPSPTTTVTAPDAPPPLPADATPVTPPSSASSVPPSVTTTSAPPPDTSDTPAPSSGVFFLPNDVTTVPFGKGAENISGDAQPIVDKLVFVMQNHPDVRITLTAYADASGITSREARRLSLTRALAIRDYLASKNIPSSRIDVRALGAGVSGNTDRVDIKAN